MSNSRYFKLSEERFQNELAEGRREEEQCRKARGEFLESWGATEYIVSSNEGRILGLKDPRTMDPPKPLPKGWRKHGSYEGFVKPSSPENRRLLDSLELPGFEAIRAHVVTHLKPLLGDVRTNRGWLFKYGGKSYFGWIRVYDLGEFGVFVSVPDPSLKYDSIPGMSEVFAWQVDRAIDLFNAKQKEKENA